MEWDITSIVQAWQSGAIAELRHVRLPESLDVGRSVLSASSENSAMPIWRPELVIEFLPLTQPSCWTATQCHGDSDGSGEVTTADWPAFRGSFGADYPEVDYNPCADYDRDGDVDTADWPAFRANFGGGSLPADCPLVSTWPPLP